MNVLIFDTETTGLFDFRKRADEDGQPRMAQIAVRLIRHKQPAEPHLLLSALNHCIKPDGWEMPAELVEQLGHGLTTEYLTENGVPVRSALEVYTEMHDKADLIAGFSADYDLKILRGEFRRAGMDDLYGQKPVFDIMRACAPICNVKNVKGGRKNPKLHEAVSIMLGRTLSGAHNAIVDCDATLDLFLELRRRGVDCSGKIPVSKLNPPGNGALPAAEAPALAPASAADDALFTD